MFAVVIGVDVMIPVEMVGGNFDGVRFEVASEEETIAVPLAYWFDDAQAVTGVEALEYGRLDRSGVDGHRLYGFVRQVVMALTTDEAPPA